MDDGRRVGFSPEHCHPMVALLPGTRVVVALAGGAEARATQVLPVVEEVETQLVWPEVGEPVGLERRYGPTGARIVEVRRTLFDREAALARHPAWHPPDAYADLAIAPVDPALWSGLGLPLQPFFAPWHEGIVAAAARCLHLAPDVASDPVAQVGGAFGPSTDAWPRCPSGHGPMLPVLRLEPEAFRGLLPNPRRLVVHVCAVCLTQVRAVELGQADAPAAVECADGSETSTPPEGVTLLPEVPLSAKRALDAPPSWLSFARRDIEGHVPLAGVGEELFGVTLRMRRSPDAPFHYERAAMAFELHYRPSFAGAVVGGFSEHHVSRCPECGEPRRQLVHLTDYLTGGELRDRLEGSNQVTLFSCDRTRRCGGPERGRLVISP